MRNGDNVAHFAMRMGQCFPSGTCSGLFIKNRLVFWLHSQFLFCNLRIAVACVDSGTYGGTWFCHHLMLAVACKTCRAEVEARLQLNPLFCLPSSW